MWLYAVLKKSFLWFLSNMNYILHIIYMVVLMICIYFDMFELWVPCTSQGFFHSFSSPMQKKGGLWMLVYMKYIIKAHQIQISSSHFICTQILPLHFLRISAKYHSIYEQLWKFMHITKLFRMCVSDHTNGRMFNQMGTFICSMSLKLIYLHLFTELFHKDFFLFTYFNNVLFQNSGNWCT